MNGCEEGGCWEEGRARLARVRRFFSVLAACAAGSQRERTRRASKRRLDCAAQADYETERAPFVHAHLGVSHQTHRTTTRREISCF